MADHGADGGEEPAAEEETGETMSMLDLRFGALADPLRLQLKAQGLIADRDELSHWQRDADAIARLAIRGLLPDAQARAARQRLINKIARRVKR